MKTLRSIVKSLAKKHPSVVLVRNGTIHALYGLAFYASKLVGMVPIQWVRMLAYRALGVKVGSKSIICHSCDVFSPRGITIGENSLIGHRGFLDGRGTLTIGDHVCIAGDVFLFTGEHDVNSQGFTGVFEPITINDRVWIGSRATVLPGVVLGEGSVVAAGAVVTKNVDAYTIVGGVPAKMIGKRRTDLAYTLTLGAWFV